MTLDLSKLRELHANATAGPWESKSHGSFFANLTRPTTAAEKKAWGLAETDTRRTSLLALSKDDMACIENPDDAALIAYVRTHLPAILERLDLVEELAMALHSYKTVPALHASMMRDRKSDALLARYHALSTPPHPENTQP